jgi:hypothetical protein
MPQGLAQEKDELPKPKRSALKSDAIPHETYKVAQVAFRANGQAPNADTGKRWTALGFELVERDDSPFVNVRHNGHDLGGHHHDGLDDFLSYHVANCKCQGQ